MVSTRCKRGNPNSGCSSMLIIFLISFFGALDNKVARELNDVVDAYVCRSGPSRFRAGAQLLF